MSFIPYLAIRFGAESHSAHPISYGKKRISGSLKFSYILHQRASSMPGQADLFCIGPCSKPSLSEGLLENRFINAFKRNNSSKLHKPTGAKYQKDYLFNFTYDEFHAHDDERFEVAILASYRQVYGNLHSMESERPIESERRLRNGDIPIREFIRELAKSPFYKKHYFENVSQQRFIELSLKHLLGRPPLSQEEVITYIESLHFAGFDNHIDSIIDSEEYDEVFGENIIPFQRCWNSPCGVTSSSFNNTASLIRGFATSDNAIHNSNSSTHTHNGQSQLLQSLANCKSLDIKFTTDSTAALLKAI